MFFGPVAPPASNYVIEVFITGEVVAKCRFFVKNCIKIGFCHSQVKGGVCGWVGRDQLSSILAG